MLESQLLRVVASLQVLFYRLGVKLAVVSLDDVVKCPRIWLLINVRNITQNLELETYNLRPEGALLHLFSAHLLVQVLHLYMKIR